MAVLSNAETRELLDRLDDLRSAFTSGDLAASSGMTARVEGAVVALSIVLGTIPVEDLIEQLSRSESPT
jgi:hypothetical protein